MNDVIVTIYGEHEVPKGGKWEVSHGPLGSDLTVYSKAGKRLYRFSQPEVLGVVKKGYEG
jgi:hypothetical protein